MDIHDPRHHTKAIAIIAALVVGGYALPRKSPTQPHDYSSASSLPAGIFSGLDCMIYVAGGAGSLPGVLADLVEADGGTATVANDLKPHGGIWVSPNSPKMLEIANKIGAALGEKITIGDDAAHPDRCEIGIGSPTRKPKP